MDDEAFTNLLDALAHRAADCLDVILLLLPATACATLRLVNRSVSAAASADSCWTPRLVAKGFTAEGLALMPALALYGRVHQLEACDIELLRRSRLRNASQEKWFAECALDLLNPFDTPVWLLFSTARDSSSASSYLQPSGGRVSLRTANGLACRGFVAANMTSNAIGGLLREMVLLRFDVERGEVSYDDSLAAGLADTTNGEAGSSSDVPAAASDAVSWLAVDAVLLPGRLAALGNKAPMLDASDDSQSDDDDDSIDFELLESETFGAQRRPQAPAVAQPQMSFTEQLRQLQMQQQQQQQQPHARTQRQRQRQQRRQREGGPAEQGDAKPRGGHLETPRDMGSVLDALTLTIGKHLFACRQPDGAQRAAFEIDVAIVSELTVVEKEEKEVPVDASLELISDAGASLSATLPPKQPRYVVGASSRAPFPPPFFPWERRLRESGAIGGPGPPEIYTCSGLRQAEQPSWIRQPQDRDLLKRPTARECRMTLLRSARVRASAVV